MEANRVKQAGVPSPPRAFLHARELLLARRELLTLEQTPNQRSKFPVRQRRKLQRAGVQPLELALGQGVEVEASNARVATRALQPTDTNLAGTGIGDRALS